METEKLLEQRIRERAYQIWIDEGQPAGKDKEHWAQAEHELGGAAERGPPLQPSQHVGDVKRVQKALQNAGECEAPSIVGGTNPDDLTR